MGARRKRMNVKLSMVLALIVVAAFPAASIYAWQANNRNSVPEPPEYARDAAIDYVLSFHDELKGLKAPSSWRERNLTPEGLVGSNTVQYTSGGWKVTIKNAVVMVPTYNVEIEYTGSVGFQWKGTVDQEGNVVETSFTLVQ